MLSSPTCSGVQKGWRSRKAARSLPLRVTPCMLLPVSISTWTVQELAWTTPTPLQSNSVPVYFAAISRLLLGVVRTSPIGEEGKGLIFPSFGLGTFPREQLTLHSANTFRSLKDFPWTYIICQLIGNFLCFFLSTHKCLLSTHKTRLLPCSCMFSPFIFPFPITPAFSVHYCSSFHLATVMASSQMTKWSYFAVSFIPT